MTELLRKAFDEASKLSGYEQNVLARQMMEELSSGKCWDKTSNETGTRRDEA